MLNYVYFDMKTDCVSSIAFYKSYLGISKLFNFTTDIFWKIIIYKSTQFFFTNN